jgi:ParB-like nuclease domain
MTETKNPVTVEIASLLRETRFQIRSSGKLDAGTVTRYANVLKAEQELPPIQVAKLNGAAVLVDGFHRVAAMERLGRLYAEAVVVEAASEDEARWLAAEANLKHGLPLKSSDMRGVFRAYVNAGRHKKGRGVKSSREIARDLSRMRGHNTILAWMRRDFPQIARQMSGGDNFNGTGGLQEKEAKGFYGDAQAGLEQLLAAAHGITAKEERGRLIKAVETALESLRNAAPWEPVAQEQEEF